jgi:ferredoxin
VRGSRYFIIQGILIRPKKAKLSARNVVPKIHNGYIPLSEPDLVVPQVITPVTFHPAEGKYRGINASGENMPGKIALVTFDKCHPEKCRSGICIAGQVCPRKILMQEAPYEIPMTNPMICRGCDDCVRACPAKAINIASQ